MNQLYQVGRQSKNMYIGKLVVLRALEKSDLDDVMKFYNTLELRRLLGPPIVRSKKYMEEWLEQVSSCDPWSDGYLVLAIEEREKDEFLGVARIEDIKLPHNRARIGVSIYNPNKRGKGLGTDAILVLLWIGFNIFGLNSIYLDTMEDNENSIHVYDKIGFKKVGILREAEYIDASHKGLLIMDILRKEFQEKYPLGSIINSQ
jgi:diamine N-acetyltransferase